MKNKKVILWVNSLFWGPHHDNGAFLFFWDDYVGISSERLDREKYSSWYKYKTTQDGRRLLYGYDKAEACISYCLDYFWISKSDIDTLVYLEWIESYIYKAFPKVKRVIGVYDHHLLHAMGAYYSSWFWEAAILVMDGQGKRIENHEDKMVLQSIYHGTRDKLSLLHETKWNSSNKIGIGTMYEMVTQLLWFSSEGTTMWLSSYSLSSEDILPWDFLRKYGDDYYANEDLLKWVPQERLKFLPKDLFLNQLSISEDFLESEKIPYWNSAKIARKIQEEMEETVLELALQAYNITGSKKLCVSWGVWLNSVANKKILDRTPFEEIFILPSTDDSGLALWAALYGRKLVYWKEDTFCPTNFYFGKEYDSEDIDLAIKKYSKYFSEVTSHKDICKTTARLLSEENIIGWFQWRSESWPRALWNRSILAITSSIKIRDKVNRIKRREWWRPLAPSVLSGHSEEYFDLPYDIEPAKYMLMVGDVRDSKKLIIPAVTHIDGTARVQIVFKQDNPLFYSLIEETYQITQIPLLLNTSFNSAGEPIVETPEEAIKMFLSSELDFLVLKNTLIKKKKVFSEFSFLQSILLNDKLYSSWKKEISQYEKFLKKDLNNKW